MNDKDVLVNVVYHIENMLIQVESRQTIILYSRPMSKTIKGFYSHEGLSLPIEDRFCLATFLQIFVFQIVIVKLLSYLLSTLCLDLAFNVFLI